MGMPWITPDQEPFWDAMSYIAQILVVVSIFGETIGNIVRKNFLPKCIQSDDRLTKIAKWSTWGLLFFLFMEVPINIAKDAISFDMQNLQKQRHIANAQKKTLIAAMKTAVAQNCEVHAVAGNSESKRYAQDFFDVVKSAGWDRNGVNGVYEDFYDFDPVGVKILVHQNDQGQLEISQPVRVFLESLIDLKLFDPRDLQVDSKIKAGDLIIRIGTKDYPPMNN